MAWTIEAALQDEAIEKSSGPNETYSFWLKGIPTVISVVLTSNPARSGYNYRLSHFIHTPCQAGPYRPNDPWGDDKAYALHLAVFAITQYYNQAIREGHEPTQEWLITNS